MGTATQPRDESIALLGVMTPTVIDRTSFGEHWFSRHPSAIPWLYLGAIAAAELETSIFSVHAGLALHCLILIMLPMHAVVARGKPYQPLLLCLTIAPLIRVMSLTLPWIGFPVMDWYLLVSIPVLVSTCMVANILGYSRSDVGLVWRRGSMQLAILLCGPVLGWTSAVAAYGSFIAPVVIGAQIKAGSPANAMYGFAIFYALCLILNWWFYLRPGSEIKNP